MNVKKYNEDQEIIDCGLDEEGNQPTMNRDEGIDIVSPDRISNFNEEDEWDDIIDEYNEDEDDYDDEVLQLGMYFDEPPRPYQRWEKTKRKRSHHSSYSPRSFRWDSDEDDEWCK